MGIEAHLCLASLLPVCFLFSLHPKVPTANLGNIAHLKDTAEYPLALHIVAGVPALGGSYHALG